MLSSAHASELLALASAAEGAVASAARSLVLADPFASVGMRVRRALGEDVDACALLAFWAARDPGSSRGAMRYRWDLSHRHGTLPAFVGAPETWRAFRGAEQALLERDPFAFEERLSTPVLLTENCALLFESQTGACAQTAALLLAEALPNVRRDFARHVQALDPWEDTFALASLVRHPAVLAAAHPVAVAIASCYCAADFGDDGALLGLRFPFHRKPLVSASAYLAGSLLTLGIELELAARVSAYVAGARRADGLWGDQPESADLPTTLAAAELLLGVDPGFDLSPALPAITAMRTGRGLWHALGPDAVWFSGRMLELLASAQRSFARRFRWPYPPAHARDQKTGLPSFAFFSELARFLGAVPWLSAAQLELAFIDLIGFRAFNNRYGQQRGDDVLRVFAQELGSLADARVVRDGGDEFLVIGAPTRTGLASELDRFRQQWPARFAACFGADVATVAPRIVVGRARGDALLRARESAGRAIIALKDLPEIGTAGVLRELGEY
jgi:diguanylate cyclase (GGDEF)-like protein